MHRNCMSNKLLMVLFSRSIAKTKKYNFLFFPNFSTLSIMYSFLTESTVFFFLFLHTSLTLLRCHVISGSAVTDNGGAFATPHSHLAADAASASCKTASITLQPSIFADCAFLTGFPSQTCI